MGCTPETDALVGRPVAGGLVARPFLTGSDRFIPIGEDAYNRIEAQKQRKAKRLGYKTVRAVIAEVAKQHHISEAQVYRALKVYRTIAILKKYAPVESGDLG